jgi:hypothetical protein
MQLNLHICGFDPRKLKAGCDGLRVRILTKVHSVEFAGLCKLRKVRGESTVRYKPRFEDLVGGLVRVMLGEIFSRILLGEGPFEVLESIRVEEVVGVVGFAWWVVRRRPDRGGGWGLGGSLHWELQMTS